jgi:molybdopterin molybdotransferase
MVAQLVKQLGGVVHDTRHLNDDADSVLAPLADLIAPADIIVTTGGISAGDRDILAAAFDDLGVTWTVIGATVKPGRPIRLGIIGETIVVCLPGNPVSALVMGALVLGRVINALLARPAPLWTPAELDCDVHPNARRTLVRPCCLKHGRLHIPQWQGSGDLVHLAPTHGVVRIPMQEATIAKGTPLPFLPWP